MNNLDAAVCTGGSTPAVSNSLEGHHIQPDHEYESSLRSCINKCLEGDIQTLETLEFSKSIQSAFKKDQGAILKQIFGEIAQDSKKFSRLTYIFAYSAPYSVVFICSFLEQLDWPQGLDKQKELNTLAILMLNGGSTRRQFFKIGYNNVALNPQESIPVTQVIVDFRPIFGDGDFIQTDIVMPSYLYKVLGEMLKCIELSEHSTKASKQDWTGISLTIGQFMECRFPATLIAPLLPYLAQMHKLVKLDLSDVGHQLDPDRIFSQTAFADDHVQTLCAILDANPCLIDFKINQASMSKSESTKMQSHIETKTREHRDNFWNGVKKVSQYPLQAAMLKQIFDKLV